MKKALALTLILMLVCVPAFAQNRGTLTNVFASWVTVTQANTTITPPYNSRDVWIHNASAVDISVNLRGETIETDGYSDTTESTFTLNGTSDFYASDFVTDSITMRSTAAAASPVSVVITY